MKRLCEWVRDCDGTTAIEYVLIGAGIALAIVAVVFTFGEDLGALIGPLAEALQG